MNMFQFHQQNVEQITGQAKEITSLILNKQYEELENYLSNKGIYAMALLIVFSKLNK